MAGGAGAAGPAPDVRHPPPGYPDLLPYNTGYAGLSRDMQTYPKTRLSRDIPGYPGITRPGVYPGITHNNPEKTWDNQPVVFLRWKNDRLNLVGLCRVIICYTILLDTLEGYPGINTRSGYPGISLVKLQQTRISHDNLGQPGKICTN